jgi:hypothetical protein
MGELPVAGQGRIVVADHHSLKIPPTLLALADEVIE